MSEFYRTLARFYDLLFPAEEDTVRFLEETFRHSPGVIVDSACGTGNYTDALSRHGFSVVGFDDDEHMINGARCCGKEGRFLTGSLEDLAALTETVPTPWGGLFCIGNSLPHVSSRDAAATFFRDAARALSCTKGCAHRSGTLVVQTINFPRFDPRHHRGATGALPSLESPGIRMEREYRPAPPRDGAVVFRMTLHEEGTPAQVGEIPLLALTPEELTAAAENAGFSDLRLYGDYHRSEYDRDNSFMIVLVARGTDSAGP